MIPTVWAQGYRAIRTIRADAHCLLVRATRADDGVPVFVKAAARTGSPAMTAELHRQARLSDWLREAGLSGAGRLIELSGGPILEIDDPGGRPLFELLAEGPLSDAAFLKLALALARWLDRVHRGERLHNAIHPYAVLARDHGAEWRIDAVDWGSSTALTPEVEQAPDVPPWVDQLVAYASPERTGRTGARIDPRSDLYSLGVVFYHLLGGAPPFDEPDSAALVHAHLARRPGALRRDGDPVPSSLSALVLSLLEKSPENRYQSAGSVVEELRYLADGFHRTGSIPPRRDPGDGSSRRFRLPVRTFGRNLEVDALRESVRAAAAGGVGVVLVEGPPGIGKSQLVSEVFDSVRLAGGSIAQGKFEAAGPDAPYGAVVDAFRELVRQHLGEPGAAFDARRDRLVSRLGGNTRVIVEAMPELEHMVGSFPPLPDLPALEAQNRFRFAFRTFVGAFSGPGHPLVLVLDDLQWADRASLELLLHIVSGSNGSFLLVATVRRAELDEGHVLHDVIERLQGGGVDVTRIPLGPLDASVIGEIVASAFGSPADRAAELGVLLESRTDGSPLFVREALERLHHDGLIRYDPGTGSWLWDIAEVRAHALSDNVADMMSERLARLTPGARHIVSIAAWLGSTFDTRTLAIACGIPREDLKLPLAEAVEIGVIAPGPDGGLTYGFLHDRVQQVAGDLVPIGEKERRHAAIGRAMLAAWSVEEVQARVFEVLRHLGPALDLLEVQERMKVADLGLIAGRRATAAMDFETAVRHLRDGLSALAERSSPDDRELLIDLHAELGRALSFSGAFDEGEAHLREALELSTPGLEKARLRRLEVICATLTGDGTAVLAAGVAGLSELGINLPLDPGTLRVGRELILSRLRLRGRKPADLLDLPEMEDEESRVALEILMDLSTFAYSRSAELAGLVFLLMTNLILRHGRLGLASYVLAIYGQVVASGLGRYEEAYEFGRTAVELSDRYGEDLYRGRARFTCAVLLNHWLDDARSDRALFDEAREFLMSAGDLLWAAFTDTQLEMVGIFVGEPLHDLFERAGAFLSFAASSHHQNVFPYHIATRLWALDLGGRTRELGQWEADLHDEAELEAEIEKSDFTPAVAFSRILRLYGLALVGDFDGALAAVDRLLPAHAMAGQLFEAESLFAEGLTLFGLLRRDPEPTHATHLRRLKEIHRRFVGWSRRCPTNFEARRLILEAGVAWTDRDAAASSLQAAAVQAESADHPHVKAIAFELLARAQLRGGDGRSAQRSFEQCIAAYRVWGAAGLIDRLEHEFPWLAVDSSPTEVPAPAPSTLPPADSVDLQSLVRVTRTSSELTPLPVFLEEVLQACLETAGARRGALIVEGDDGLVVEALVGPGGEDQPSTPSRLDEAGLAANIVRYVARTGETIVLDDAVAEPRFGTDPHTATLRQLSVLCSPLTHRGHRTGLLYLENELAAGAFSVERTHILEVLANQAAISLENARIQDRSEVLLRSFARFVPGRMVQILGKESVVDVLPGDAVRREMTVLFSDLRGFTRQSEDLGAAESFAWLNAYLARISPIVGFYGGFVDKFVGDATMALFPDEAAAAVRAAVGMSQEIRSLNADRARRRGVADFRMGIGLDFGPVMLGAVGSSGRMEITAIGDAVNLASRLEAATKALNSPLLISASVHDRLIDPEEFMVRPLGRVSVAGRATLVDLFEVLDGESPERIEPKRYNSSRLSEGISSFRHGDFAAGISDFQACLEADPGDGAARAYLDAALAFRHQPPDASWKGELRLTKK